MWISRSGNDQAPFGSPAISLRTPRETHISLRNNISPYRADPDAVFSSVFVHIAIIQISNEDLLDLTLDMSSSYSLVLAAPFVSASLILEETVLTATEARQTTAATAQEDVLKCVYGVLREAVPALTVWTKTSRELCGELAVAAQPLSNQHQCAI
jgi:hypothetical protein